MKASRFATMRSVMRDAGRVVKSKLASGDGAVDEEDGVAASGASSGSSLARLASGGRSAEADVARFRDSAAAAFRFLSSAAAASIRAPCTARTSPIIAPN